jgi:hypothetical protein
MEVENNSINIFDGIFSHGPRNHYNIKMINNNEFIVSYFYKDDDFNQKLVYTSKISFNNDYSKFNIIDGGTLDASMVHGVIKKISDIINNKDLLNSKESEFFYTDRKNFTTKNDAIQCNKESLDYLSKEHYQSLDTYWQNAISASSPTTQNLKLYIAANGELAINAKTKEELEDLCNKYPFLKNNCFIDKVIRDQSYSLYIPRQIVKDVFKNSPAFAEYLRENAYIQNDQYHPEEKQNQVKELIGFNKNINNQQGNTNLNDMLNNLNINK